MDLHGAFHRGLRVEFGRERDLEQHVFHHVSAVGALELEGLALEQHVVETPDRRGQHGRIAHFAGAGHQGQAYGTAGGVASRPGLAAAGVGRVTISAQALAVHPGEGHGVDGFLARQTQHLGHHGGGGDLHQHHVVQADLVEGVFQRDAALDFVRLDHAFQHRAHGERRLAGGHGVARQPVGHGQDAAQVVGRMAPFGRQPGVVEVQPADHAADIERGLHRIQLELRAGNLGAVGDDGAGHDGAHELAAGRVFQAFQAAAQGVDQAVAGGFERQRTVDLVVEHVIDDVHQDLVGLGTDVGNGCGHGDS